MSNIIKYLSNLMAGYTDFQAICAAENPELELLGDATAEADNNALIMSASEPRIYEWEKMLDIVPADELPLYNRRRRLQYYLQQPPNHALKNVLSEVTRWSVSQTISFELAIDDYYFKIICDVPVDMWSTLYKKLVETVPANMIFEVENIITSQIYATLRCGGATKRKSHRRIGF